MRMRALEDGVVPGTNLGVGFTTSIAEKSIALEGGENYLAEMVISYKGDGTGVVAMETFLDLVNPLSFKANNPRINLRGRDIFALNIAWFGNVPAFIEGGSGTDDKVAGMRIPLQVVPGQAEALAYSITRAAVANIATEVLRLSLRSFESIPEPMPGRIDAKEILVTTPASLGIADLVETIPRIGRLMGILVFQTTVPTESADTADVQRAFLETPRGRFGDYHVQDMMGAFTDYFQEIPTGPLQDILANYGWIELREEPIDLVTDEVKIKADVGVVSEAVRFIPVIEVAQGG